MGKVTSKLQLTLPKRLADELGIAPGDEIDFESAGDHIRLIPRALHRGNELSASERLRLFDGTTARCQ